MCGSATKGRYRFDRYTTRRDAYCRWRCRDAAAADASRSTCEANAARATSWPTTRLIRRVRGVVAFIVGVTYWARELIKARYRVLKFTIAPPAIALCNSINVWNFQSATTVYGIDRTWPMSRSDRSDHSPNRPLRPTPRTTTQPTMNAILHFLYLYDNKHGRRRGRRRMSTIMTQWVLTGIFVRRYFGHSIAGGILVLSQKALCYSGYNS